MGVRPGTRYQRVPHRGDDGVEASLYATIVIAILTWFTYRYYRRTEAQRAGTPVPTPEYDKGSGESTAVESPAA